MNNEFLKGVLDAKLSRLLSGSDYNTFASLSSSEQLSFFINHNLVSTNIVSNFEALTKYAHNDLKTEINGYMEDDTLYVRYFFSEDYAPKTKGAKIAYLNAIYAEAEKRHDSWLLMMMDTRHALLNVMHILRGKIRGDDEASLKDHYLSQKLISVETFATLLSSDRPGIFNFLKSDFNLDIDPDATNVEVEAILDAYLLERVRAFAIESELLPTLIYYIVMKKHEILRLRELYYGRGTTNG